MPATQPWPCLSAPTATGAKPAGVKVATAGRADGDGDGDDEGPGAVDEPGWGEEAGGRGEDEAGSWLPAAPGVGEAAGAGDWSSRCSMVPRRSSMCDSSCWIAASPSLISATSRASASMRARIPARSGSRPTSATPRREAVASVTRWKATASKSPRRSPCPASNDVVTKVVARPRSAVWPLALVLIRRRSQPRRPSLKRVAPTTRKVWPAGTPRSS